MTSPSRPRLLSQLARQLFSLRKSSFLICSSLLLGPALGQQANVNVVAKATGTTGAVVATMPAVAGFRNWICGFDVSGIGTAVAAISPIVIAGISGGSLTYDGVLVGLATGVGGTPNPVTKIFSPCVPASAANTAITVTTTADGTATAVDVNVWGYTSP